VATKPPLGEEVTGAVPLPLFIANGIGVVLPPEAHCEVGKIDALPLLCILLRLFDLADET